MQREIVISVMAILAFFGPKAGCADPSKLEQPSIAGQFNWVRRQGQVVQIVPEQFAKFREQIARPAMEVQAAMKARHLKNQSVFVIELGPDQYVAFRYGEYDGRDFAQDMAILENESSYGPWRRQLDTCLTGGWADMECVFFTAGQSTLTIPEDRVMRFGQVVGLRPDMVESYKLMHANAWPDVLAKIEEGNIRNYSIFLAPIESKMYLFAYFEYVGRDFASDMAVIDSDSATKAWMKFTDDACQLPIPTRKPGEWWAGMEPVSTLRDVAIKNDR